MTTLFYPISKYAIGLMIILSVATHACKKDNTPPIERLPPLSHSGENTFGCLVNGQAFVPKRLGVNPVLQAAYQQIYTSDSGRSFSAVANHFNSSCNFQSVSIESENIRLQQDGTYPLVALMRGNFSGRYGVIRNCDEFPTPLYTTAVETGQLHITFLDTINQIVSGTFFFDVKDESGNVYHITDGRFDLRYVR